MPSFHFPFLVQVNNMPRIPDWESDCGPALWCVVHFVTLKPKTGKHFLYAAVLPCSAACSVSTHPLFGVRHKTYRVDLHSKISFARMDDSVRVCGLLHSCAELRCDTETNQIYSRNCDGLSPLDGCHFLSLTRREGYPPRQG